MDAKGKKVFAALTKLGEDSDAFDVSMAAKMEEDAVEKILESLVSEGAATSRTNDKGKALYTAVKGGGAAAKPAKPKKEKAEADVISDDDDDEFTAKKSGGCPIVPLAVVGVLAVVAIILAVVMSSGNASKGALGALKSDFDTYVEATNAKIAALEASRDELKTEVDSLKAQMARRDRPAPAAGGSRPTAARSAQQRRR